MGGYRREVGGTTRTEILSFFDNIKHHLCGRDFKVLGPTCVDILYIFTVLVVFGLSVERYARVTQPGVELPNAPAGPQPGGDLAHVFEFMSGAGCGGNGSRTSCFRGPQIWVPQILSTIIS